MSRAFVFPGQGSQSVGMGREIAEAYKSAQAVFDEVDEALGEKLSETIWNGTGDELTLTQNAQPALMAVSLATLRALQEEGVELRSAARFVAGHSLGEYSALAAAGALSIGDTAKLLRTRGRAMQQAVPVGQGAMAALLGIDLDVAVEIAEAAAEGEVVGVANDNAPGQVVVSGAKPAVERAMAIAKERGAMKAVELPVSAPFHSALMQPAAEVMAEALASVEIGKPEPALVANVVAAEVTDPEEIRRLLVEQVTGTVRWRESVAYMAGEGVTELVEVGAGRVLSGLAKRIDRSVKGLPLNKPEDVKAFAEAIR